MKLQHVIYTLSLSFALSACSQNLPSAVTDASSTGVSSTSPSGSSSTSSTSTSGGVSSVTLGSGGDTGTVVVTGGGSSSTTSTTTNQLTGIVDLSGAAVTSGTAYYLRNLSTGNCLDVQGDLTVNSTRIQSYACGANKTNQEWIINVNADGVSVNMISVHSQRSLDLSTQAIGSSNQFLQIYDYGNGPNQNWVIVPVSGGGYHLRNVSASTQCVEDSGVVNAQTCVATAAETYTLIPLSRDPAQ